MNRWWGSAEDSDKQAGERSQRAARRTIAAQLVLSESDEDDFKDCDLSKSFLGNLDGNDSVPASDDEEDTNPPAIMVKFEDENGVDDADYYKKLSSLKNRNFNPKQVQFWFTSIEASLKHMGVKSQWSKREVLHSLLPDDVQVDVMHILKKDQDSTGITPYKTLKNELLKLYAPKPEAAFERAINRKLSQFNKPSSYFKAIVDDLCTCNEPLASECCQRVIQGLFVREMPENIRDYLAGKKFDNTTYKSLIEVADAKYESSQKSPSTPVVAAAKVQSKQANLDETQPAIPYSVDAIQRGGRGGRGGRGRGNGRGGRGGRGRGQARPQNNSNSNDTSGTNWPTPKHPDGAPSGSCFNHHTYGRQAYHCTDPLSCPWASIPPHPRQKPVNK